MKKLWISLLVLPLLAACPGDDGGDDSLVGLLLLQATPGECEQGQPPALGETVDISNSRAALDQVVPAGATSIHLNNISNSDNEGMYPNYLDGDCNSIGDASNDVTAATNDKPYTLPSGVKTVRIELTGSVTTYSAEATFN